MKRGQTCAFSGRERKEGRKKREITTNNKTSINNCHASHQEKENVVALLST